LRLPAEIRNQIWSQVIGAKRIVLHNGSEDESKGEIDGGFSSAPSDLLYVCRQTYVEVLSLPPTVVRFDISKPNGFDAWLRDILPVQPDIVQEVQLCCSNYAGSPWKSLPKLNMVEVMCGCDGSHFDQPRLAQSIKDELAVLSGKSRLKVCVTSYFTDGVV
jgi:hypothetical protein